MTLPMISIIIPVYNAGQYLERCLNALINSSYPSFEIIVVNDCSTDDSAEIAPKKRGRVCTLPQQSGPAAARNYGAKVAQGAILFFVDADVVVQRDTLMRIAILFQEHPDLAAVFGSYDDDPAERNFLSQYKNLLHHFVHQHSNTEAVSFWAGCGAIRREVFFAIGGFDSQCYPRPTIEDIELGYRLRKKGYRILLDKQLQVKHLKKWTVQSLLVADIWYRAVPWSKLLLQSQEMLNDLNLQQTHKISAGLVGLLVLSLLFVWWKPWLLYLVVSLLGLIFYLNYDLYRFFGQRRGFLFLIQGFIWHLFYYLYSGVTFGWCWLVYRYSQLRKIS